MLELGSLPCDTLNIALHLVASLILVSQDLPEWENWTADIVMVVSKRVRKEMAEEVEMVIGFFQEISQNLCGSLQVKRLIFISLS